MPHDKSDRGGGQSRRTDAKPRRILPRRFDKRTPSRASDGRRPGDWHGITLPERPWQRMRRRATHLDERHRTNSRWISFRLTRVFRRSSSSSRSDHWCWSRPPVLERRRGCRRRSCDSGLLSAEYPSVIVLQPGEWRRGRAPRRIADGTGLDPGRGGRLPGPIRTKAFAAGPGSAS